MQNCNVTRTWYHLINYKTKLQNKNKLFGSPAGTKLNGSSTAASQFNSIEHSTSVLKLKKKVCKFLRGNRLK